MRTVTQDRQMYVWRNIEVLSCHNYRRGKSIRIPYSDDVFVALVTEHAMHMRHIDICGLSILQYFSALSHKGQDFWKKVIKHEINVSIFSRITVWSIFHSKKNWERYDEKCVLIFM